MAKVQPAWFRQPLEPAKRLLLSIMVDPVSCKRWVTRPILVPAV
jgi:hypothetical protein